MVRCSELSDAEIEAFKIKQKAKAGPGGASSSSSDDDAKTDQIIFEERLSRRETEAGLIQPPDVCPLFLVFDS